MFNKIIGLVTSPQVAMEACQIATVFGELNDFSENEIGLCVNDYINFIIDVEMGYTTPL